MGFFWRIWGWLRQLVGLVLPLFSKARDFAGLGPTFRAILHVGAVLLVLLLLAWLNWVFALSQVLPGAPRVVQYYLYLPLLFLIVYLLSWLGWWLWKLLWAEDEASPFPDIDAAWAEAVQALHKQGIDVRDLPLFLVLGRPAAGEAPLFQAAQLKFVVQQEPRRPDAPLRVWAGPDGIYLTCAQASLLGRLAELLARAGQPGSVPEMLVDGAFDPYKTLPPQGRMREIQAILARAHSDGRRPDQLTDAERDKIHQLVAEDEEGAPGRAPVARPSLLKDHDEVERCLARLRHLCRLVTRDRRPYCPVNGILVLLPLEALTDDETASETASVCQHDLNAARQQTQMICPVFVMVCDLEAAPGFGEFLSRFPGEQRFGRLGQRFPLVSELKGETLTRQVTAAAYWICRGLLPTHIHKLFHVESGGDAENPTGKLDQAAAVKGNRDLYQLLVHVRKAARNLGRVLTRGVASGPAEPVLFGGCYLSGTGANAQGFVAGVFRRLKQCEDVVSWTPEAFAEEEHARRWTQYGYVALAVFVGVIAVAAVVKMIL
jgi:hypothetical protein